MAVDGETSMEIAGPRSEVAAYASDPANATVWYENIKSVEWRTPKPLTLGSKFAFEAQFLGRRLAYSAKSRPWRAPGSSRCAPPKPRSRWRPPTPGEKRPAAERA